MPIIRNHLTDNRFNGTSDLIKMGGFFKDIYTHSLIKEKEGYDFFCNPVVPTDAKIFYIVAP